MVSSGRRLSLVIVSFGNVQQTTLLVSKITARVHATCYLFAVVIFLFTDNCFSSNESRQNYGKFVRSYNFKKFLCTPAMPVRKNTCVYLLADVLEGVSTCCVAIGRDVYEDQSGMSVAATPPAVPPPQQTKVSARTI